MHRKNKSDATPPRTRFTDPVPGRLVLASVTACEHDLWAFHLAPAEPGMEAEPMVAPFSCKSWRCRRCGWWVAQDDLRRITAGATARRWWLYAVLTFDTKAFACAWDAYRDALWRWERVRKRLKRAFGKVEYLQTWERHTRGQFPHLNVLLTGEGLREHVESTGVVRTWSDDAAHGSGRWCMFPRAWRRDWWRPAVMESGFGRVTWCEVIDDAAGMAAYLTKAARDLASSRYKPGDQSPIGAPPHFRRLRATPHLLPPREQPKGLWSATLVRGEGRVELENLIAGGQFDDATQLAAKLRDEAEAWAALPRRKKAPQYERARPVFGC